MATTRVKCDECGKRRKYYENPNFPDKKLCGECVDRMMDEIYPREETIKPEYDQAAVDEIADDALKTIRQDNVVNEHPTKVPAKKKTEKKTKRQPISATRVESVRTFVDAVTTQHSDKAVKKNGNPNKRWIIRAAFVAGFTVGEIGAALRTDRTQVSATIGRRDQYRDGEFRANYRTRKGIVGVV